MTTCVRPIPAPCARRHPLGRKVYLAVLALCLAATVPLLGLRVASAVDAGQRVYTMADLEARLARDPAAWLHRSLQVRALVGGQCTATVGLYARSCSSWRMALTAPNAPADPAADGDIQPLPLSWGKAPTLLAFLRHIPVVKGFIPPRQIIHSSVPAVYRIQLQPTVCVLSANPPCYEAVLLDAIPPDDSADWVQIGS